MNSNYDLKAGLMVLVIFHYFNYQRRNSAILVLFFSHLYLLHVPLFTRMIVLNLQRKIGLRPF